MAKAIARLHRKLITTRPAYDLGTCITIRWIKAGQTHIRQFQRRNDL